MADAGILSSDLTASIKYVDVVIPSGASLPAAGIDLKAHRLHHVILPESWDGGALGAQMSPDDTAAYIDVYGASAIYSLVPAAVQGASRCIIVTLADMYGFRFLKLKSASNVSADRTIRLGLIPR
jgi:hypothetical protein